MRIGTVQASNSAVFIGFTRYTAIVRTPCPVRTIRVAFAFRNRAQVIYTYFTLVTIVIHDACGIPATATVTNERQGTVYVVLTASRIATKIFFTTLPHWALAITHPRTSVVSSSAPACTIRNTASALSVLACFAFHAVLTVYAGALTIHACLVLSLCSTVDTVIAAMIIRIAGYTCTIVAPVTQGTIFLAFACGDGYACSVAAGLPTLAI